MGIFRGFSEGGLEFHADLVLPYRPEYHDQPMHGQFVLVQLAHENEAVLGRITSLRSEGRLVSPEGEDYSTRLATQGLPIPEDLREQYLKYRVNIRVLGVVRQESDELTFVASHRRLPHVGSPVAFLDARLLRYVAGHDGPGAELGFLAMGTRRAGQHERPSSLLTDSPSKVSCNDGCMTSLMKSSSVTGSWRRPAFLSSSNFALPLSCISRYHFFSCSLWS